MIIPKNALSQTSEILRQSDNDDFHRYLSNGSLFQNMIRNAIKREISLIQLITVTATANTVQSGQEWDINLLTAANSPPDCVSV